MKPKQICTGCRKLKKIILAYSATVEINGKEVASDVRLCRDCLLKQHSKPQK